MLPSFIILLLITTFVMILIFAEDRNKVIALFCSPIIFLVCIISDTQIKEYKLYPVEYTIVKTPVKIIVVTDYGTFESDKLIDNQNWSKNSTGYIIKAYDYFGHEDFKEFTTTPYDKNINYTNEHR